MLAGLRLKLDIQHASFPKATTRCYMVEAHRRKSAEGTGPGAGFVLYEGGGGCQGGLGREPQGDRGIAGRGGSGQAPRRAGARARRVLALDAAGRVWQWVRARGRAVGG